MQSENFDNRIKEAAEQHHPNYDEKAWAKMEKLLDRHLPQKDDRRRRIIFFLLFFLLLGGGAWLFISKPWQQKDQTLTTVNKPHKNGPEPSVGSTKETIETAPDGNSNSEKRKDKKMVAEPYNGTSGIADKKKDIANVQDAGISKQKRSRDIIVTGDKGHTNSDTQKKILPAKTNKTDQLTVDVENPVKIKTDKTSPGNDITLTVPNITNITNDKKPGNDNTKTRTDLPANTEVSQKKVDETKKDNVTQQTEAIDKKEIAKKSNSKKRNSFYFSFSAGPDISSIGLDNPGKVKISAGAGFGYTIKDRFTIRAGFYTGRKVYSASRYDYKPSVPPYNYNYLDKIDADCKVYEIPVSLAYNFNLSKKNSWFGAAGLSSYIMKKETYRYLYKTPVPYTYTKTINNGNKHYFSVLTLSGGYQRRINKTLSIAAEPYIKLPLAGVGFGKVKLNSAGVLFSLSISPFQKGIKK